MSIQTTNTQSHIVKLSMHDIAIGAVMSGDQQGDFQNLITCSNIYSEAGLTPVFLYNMIDGEVRITSEENLQKKFH